MSHDKISEETEKILRRLPNLKFSKYVDPRALNQTAKALEIMPKLEFPINSPGEFVEQLGGPDKQYVVEGKTLYARMATRIPVYYFPIVSVENLVEKMAVLLEKSTPKNPENLGATFCCTYDGKFGDTYQVQVSDQLGCPYFDSIGGGTLAPGGEKSGPCPSTGGWL